MTCLSYKVVSYFASSAVPYIPLSAESKTAHVSLYSGAEYVHLSTSQLASYEIQFALYFIKLFFPGIYSN